MFMNEMKVAQKWQHLLNKCTFHKFVFVLSAARSTFTNSPLILDLSQNPLRPSLHNSGLVRTGAFVLRVSVLAIDEKEGPGEDEQRDPETLQRGAGYIFCSVTAVSV